MAVADTSLDGNPKQRPMLAVLKGLVLALVLGGAGFLAVWSGLFPDSSDPAGAGMPGPLTGIAFVPLDAMVISLGPGAASSHLRFSAQVEVADTAVAEVTRLSPRILDVLNSYLRAIDTAAIEDPGAMAKLRAQMLRRIQIVTGDGQVRDLLITEFVLN